MFNQIEEWIYSELNSQSDNPKITKDKVYYGGNFYGGYLAFAADHLASIIVKVSELLDRQTFHYVSGKKNLPTNLVREVEGEYYHGLKGLHQVSNSLLMKLIPMGTSHSLATRSSESHNQDMVSNCANAWLRISEMRSTFQTMVSIHMIMGAQSLDILKANKLDPKITKIHEHVRRHVAFLEKDQSLKKCLNELHDSLNHVAYHEGLF